MLLPLILFAAAYFLIEGGMQFLGILAAIIGFLLLIASSKKSSSAISIHEPMGPNGPIIVEQKLPPIPSSMKLKIKPDWEDRVTFEYAAQNTGWALDKIFRWLFYILAGSKPKAKKH